MNPNTKKSRISESIKVRGVAGALQAMALPTIGSAISLFKEVGIKLKRNNNYNTN